MTLRECSELRTGMSANRPSEVDAYGLYCSHHERTPLDYWAPSTLRLPARVGDLPLPIVRTRFCSGSGVKPTYCIVCGTVIKGLESSNSTILFFMIVICNSTPTHARNVSVGGSVACKQTPHLKDMPLCVPHSVRPLFHHHVGTPSNSLSLGASMQTRPNGGSDMRSEWSAMQQWQAGMVGLIFETAVL